MKRNSKFTKNFTREHIESQKVTFPPVYSGCKILEAVEDYKLGIEGDETKIIKMLRKYGIDIKKVIEEESHPLIEAIKSDNISFFNELIANGVGVNFIDSLGYTPLYYAVAYSKPEICKLLLKLEDTNNSTIVHSTSPIILAIYQDDLPLCEVLIRYGTNIKEEFGTFKTPFVQALTLNRIDICKLFLDLNKELNLDMEFNFSRILNKSDELAIHIVSNELIDKEKLGKSDLYYYNKLEKKVDKLLTNKTLELAAKVLEFAEALDDTHEVELLAKEDIHEYSVHTPQADL